MNTLILYTSQSGFTKRYAFWISEKIENSRVLPLQDAIKYPDSFFDEYDAIIYGGWTMGGKVVKSEWFLERIPQWKNKKLAIYCCGATPNENPDIKVFTENMLTEEQKKYAKAFYCQGGVNYKKMKFFSKLAMKAFVSMLRNKSNKTQNEINVMFMLDHSYDISDHKYAEDVANYILGK